MIARSILAAFVILVLAAPAAANCTAEGRHDARTVRTICDLEREWGQSLVSGDPKVVERMLADDFVGVDTKGKLYRKAAEVGWVRSAGASSHFTSDIMNDVIIRFYGITAVAQGSDSWTGKSSKKGRFVWTDVWAKRHGRWQIVATESLVAP
jgi:hypothetical protein